jgi:O-antigen/teichoic acid export membrane protein
LVAFALIAMAIVLAPMGVRLALGASFEGAVLAIQILLVSTMPALLSRLNGLRLTAAGLIRANSMVALLRTFVAVGLLLLLAHWQSEVISVHHLAVCWLLGECAAAFLSHSLLVRFAVRPSQ